MEAEIIAQATVMAMQEMEVVFLKATVMVLQAVAMIPMMQAPGLITMVATQIL